MSETKEKPEKVWTLEETKAYVMGRFRDQSERIRSALAEHGGLSPATVWGARTKRPPLGLFEAALKELRLDGSLRFNSGVWYRP